MADKKPLTDVFLRKLTLPKQGQLDIWDAKIPGFGIRVSSTGTKTFVMVYRFRGHWRRDSLGQYPKTSLQDARQKAERARADLGEGQDPREDRTSSRPAAKGGSFETIVDAFIDTHAKRNNRPSTAAETERLIRAVFVPVWKRHALTDIARVPGRGVGGGSAAFVGGRP